MFKSIIKSTLAFPLRFISNKMIVKILRHRAKSKTPSVAVRELLELENSLYSITGKESGRYGNGLHTKHKHIKYHNFFIENIKPASNVLDVGCGNGALAYDIANNTENVNIYGIDISEGNIKMAKQKYTHPNVEYVCGDALTDLPDRHFDVVILSNVLEHIDKRVDVLKTLNNLYKPEQFLIRVPIYERDWRVPLMEELGVDYRLDGTHFIEFKLDEFYKEIKESGLSIISEKVNWGEIWAVIKPLG